MIEIGGTTLEWWSAILAVVVLVVGAARLTRILTYDDFPLSIAIRVWWQKTTKDGPWAKLVTCPWCAGPWITLIALASFIVATYVPVLFAMWWLFWGWLALSYWVSQYVHFDEGKGEE